MGGGSGGVWCARLFCCIHAKQKCSMLTNFGGTIATQTPMFLDPHSTLEKVLDKHESLVDNVVGPVGLEGARDDFADHSGDGTGCVMRGEKMTSTVANVFWFKGMTMH
jgi:hypothetical protein